MTSKSEPGSESPSPKLTSSPNTSKNQKSTPDSTKRRSSIEVPGRKVINDFLVGKVLGEGAYARVFIVRLKENGKDYAMKVMEKKFIVKEGKSKEIQMERRVLSEVSHPNIVRLFFSFHDNYRLYMILDFCAGGELAKLIRFSREKMKNRALTEDQTRFYLSETISAVQHLHSVGILHRDLKPENVLIAANGHVKITDFGTAKDMKQTRASDGSSRKDTFCGTAEYVSPEVLQDQEAAIGADLWALGIMTYSMLIGKTPFLCDSEFLTFQCILSYSGVQQTEELLDEDTMASIPKLTPETFSFPESPSLQLSPVSLDLVKRLLKPIPNERLGFSSPNDLRVHDFFKALDFSKLDQVKPPSLPYSIEYEAPFIDGGKQYWLVTDSSDFDDLEDEKLLQKQSSASSSGLEKFLKSGETVVLDGAVSVFSYGGLVSNRRHMILTSSGRAIFVDPATLTLKEEFQVKNAVVSVKSNSKDFEIQTAKRCIKLKDLLGSAERWRDAIGKL